jgi:hypothetical protein
MRWAVSGPVRGDVTQGGAERAAHRARFPAVQRKFRAASERCDAELCRGVPSP